MSLARIFRAGLACLSQRVRKIPARLAAGREAARRSTRPEIYHAIANMPANRRAVVRWQRELRRRMRLAEWKGAAIAYSPTTPWSIVNCGLGAALHGLGAGLGPASGIANPYLASVARPGSLFTNSRNARAASLSLAFFSMTTACSIAG